MRTFELVAGDRFLDPGTGQLMTATDRAWWTGHFGVVELEARDMTGRTQWVRLGWRDRLEAVRP